VICVDEMGPLSARTHAGQELVRPCAAPGRPAGRARQEVDYGRRTTEGYVFGGFRPATGEALTATYPSRSSTHFADFLDRLDAWVPAAAERAYVILDNLNVHRGYDVLLFNLAHPRWEFVFQPRRAAYLNLIEPWWKVLKPLALKGRRLESWPAVEAAVAQGCAYWNAHRHPFVWGRRRRPRVPRRLGIACTPTATSI
jgi:DDE superfamily endonuclease